MRNLPTTPSRPASAQDTAPAKPESTKRASALFNFWIDVALGASLVVVVWVSILLQVVFPAPTAADGWRLWGWTYDQWRDGQFYALCVCVLLALEHVVLHWHWVCGVVATKILRVKKRPDEANQAMYGIAFFFALVLVIKVITIIAFFTVKQPATR